MKRKIVVSGNLVRLLDVENQVPMPGYSYAGIYPGDFFEDRDPCLPCAWMHVNDVALVVCTKAYVDRFLPSHMINEILLIVNGSMGWFDSSQFCIVQ